PSDHSDIAGNDNVDSYGIIGQAGYMVIPDKLEPFVRYEWTELDDDTLNTYDQISILTVGANYYFKQHQAKFTLDVQWVMDPINDDDAVTAGGANLNGTSNRSLDLGALGLLDTSED